MAKLNFSYAYMCIFKLPGKDVPGRAQAGVRGRRCRRTHAGGGRRGARQRARAAAGPRLGPTLAPPSSPGSYLAGQAVRTAAHAARGLAALPPDSSGPRNFSPPAQRLRSPGAGWGPGRRRRLPGERAVLPAEWGRGAARRRRARGCGWEGEAVREH